MSYRLAGLDKNWTAELENPLQIVYSCHSLQVMLQDACLRIFQSVDLLIGKILRL